MNITPHRPRGPVKVFRCAQCRIIFKREVWNGVKPKFCSSACTGLAQRVTPTESLRRHTRKSSSGCWTWTGNVSESGYAYACWGGRMQLAHRMAYEVHFGPIPKGMLVCHKCDVRSCVRPDHLFLGSYKDNMDDAMRKGRMRKTGRLLTEDIVREARARRDAGESIKAIQASLPVRVTRCSIMRVLKRQTWKGVA